MRPPGSPGPADLASEEAFLELIERHFPSNDAARREFGGAHLLNARTDDAALIAAPQRLLVTTDLLQEDVHFRRRYCAPGDIGHKALAVNLSDLAAMGAEPLGFSMGLSVPPGLDAAFWDGFMAGMAAMARQWGVVLTGGDLIALPNGLPNGLTKVRPKLEGAGGLGVAITAWGGLCCRSPKQPSSGTAPTGRVLTRGTARPGDRLYAVGRLGLARVGFERLEAGLAMDAFPVAHRAFLRPEPRVEAGLQLATFGDVTACMDVSDGLARDLPRLLASREGGDLGADLRPTPSLVHPELEAHARETGQVPMELLLAGGEDYALLCATAPTTPLEGRLTDCYFLGTVSAEPGVRLHGQPVTARGHDHFG